MMRGQHTNATQSTEGPGQTEHAQTFEDFGESTDVREGRAAAPRVTHVHQPWIEGLDVLVFVRNETMLHEGTANINSK